MPPKINLKMCTGCGACVGVCPATVLKIVGGKASVANAKACLGCRACEATCPNGAISF